ncbi:FecR family protein [Dyadobacter soli]|uniref:FecR family protein n=1 Tax=Dyadobacter soli TaxID=659014 RepID=A0A1G6ZLM7_9BACT|nr:FecR family protein [Dyadobacter soli]SDE03714.1 FecR family protein [Dyadobacter soli]
MNYRDYTAIEFAADPFFRSWVFDQDPDAVVFWDNWTKEHPDRREELDEARALLYVLKENESYVDAEQVEERVQDMLAQVRGHTQRSQASMTPAFYRFLGIAASICLIGGLGWLGYSVVSRQPDNPARVIGMHDRNEGIVVRFNHTADPVAILLEDSSVVTLAPESELTFPEKFAREKREVHLKGEAFFQISHDSDRPFLVKTKELVTRVLGTSFTVRSFEKDPDASVSVKTGRVSVYSKREERGAGSPGKVIGVILKPNQRALFDKQESRLVKVIVDAPMRLTNAPAASLVFDEAPVRNVFQTLEKEYGIELFFNEERLSDCQLTANLSGLPMYEQLDLICRIIHAKYEVVDGQVIIHGDGCKAD